jgi:hypothetical protein
VIYSVCLSHLAIILEWRSYRSSGGFQFYCAAESDAFGEAISTTSIDLIYTLLQDVSQCVGTTLGDQIDHDLLCRRNGDLARVGLT